MDEPLRPHVAIASAPILDIIARRAGGYAVLTAKGIELFDEALGPRGVIATEAVGNLEELETGRFLAHSSNLRESLDGRAFETVDTGTFLRDLVVTPARDGFIAIGHERIVIDRMGSRTVLEIADDRIDAGGAAWGAGAVIAGREGLTILDDRGAEVARSGNVWLTERPVVAGSRIVAPGPRDIRVFDEHAREVGQIPRRPARKGLHAFGRGVLVCVDIGDEEADGSSSELSCWEIVDDVPLERWRVVTPRPWEMYIVGDRAVVASEHAVQIIDIDGVVRDTLEVYVLGAVAFAGGIALTANQLLWWRDGHELQVLEHDVRATVARTVPLGLATAEDDVLFLWRTDVQGSAAASLATDLPLGAPIVVNGALVTIESAARFALRARTAWGTTIALRPGGAWRHATTRDEARRVFERLLGRVFDAPLPEVACDATYADSTSRLAQLPLAQTVDLYGRSWFAPSTLDPELQPHAMYARAAFLAELASALGTSARVLLATLRARKSRLEPPAPVVGFDYLGTFTTSGALTVADPVHVGRSASRARSLPLSLEISGHDGIWHVFLRDANGEPGRTAELAVVHESGFSVHASDLLGTIGVDAGCAGVFDAACPKWNPDHPLEEGTCSGLGAIAWSGYGDGMYPVFAGQRAGKVAKIRVVFIGDAPEVDRLVATPAGVAAKPYRASVAFAVGDTLDHPKFGVGSVLRVGSDGKIDVRFADATRTLVHGKK